MSITIEEALTIPPFSKSKIIAGANGLDRIITSVSAMDAPDLFNWIQGNELILTSGYFVKHLSIYEQIKKVSVKGAAGLAIKLNRYVETIDEEVIKLANELKFPLISLPFEHPWVDFVTLLVSAIVDKKTTEIEHSKKIFESFTNIVLKGGDFSQIIQSLSKVSNKNCSLFDTKGEMICTDSDTLFNWQDIKQLYNENLKKINDVIWHNIMKIGNKKYSLVKCQVKSGQEHYGDIFMIYEYHSVELSDWDIIALKQVSTVLCLEFQKRKAVEAVERNYQESFLSDILLGQITDSEVIEQKSKFFGLNIKKGGTVVIIDFENKHLNVNSALLFQTSVKRILEYCLSGTRSIITFIADQIVLFIPSGCDVHKKINTISEQVKEKYPKDKYKIAIGRTFLDYRKISQSYNDANNVIKLGNFEDDIIDYKQLGVIRLILENISKDKLNEYFDEYLGPVLAYQRENNIDLLSTLSVYYQENCNIRNAAKRLFLHFNTVKYRLNLINDILLADINDPNVKNTLSIALKLMNIASFKEKLN